MKTTPASNISLLWGQLIIESLVRCGVTHFFVAPGSRSTPLTLAAHEHPEVSFHTHFDERGLGYFALGAAKALTAPVAVITTSGTAVANLYPAIIEAKLTQVPLIILTADRPEELHQCGANQAIDQVGIFANHTVWRVDLATASTQIPANYVLTHIEQGLFAQQQQSGPIHINCKFREPFYAKQLSQDLRHYLASVHPWLTSQSPYLQKRAGQTNTPPLPDWNEVQQQRGLIVVGRLTQIEQAQEIAAFAQALGWPLLMDIQSSGKGHPWSLNYYDQLLHHADFVEQLNQAEVILQFGDRLVSKRLLHYLSQTRARLIQVQTHQEATSPNHTMGQYYCADIATWLAVHPVTHHHPWGEWLYQADQAMAQFMEQGASQQGYELSEVSVSQCLTRLAPDNSTLFIGNSLPVRLMDMFAQANSKQQRVFTNRGASGIDGILASAIGVALILEHRPTTLLVGDTSLLHDLNSLALSSQLTSALVVIVLNNDGGSIFNLLPVPEESDVVAQCYQLPHGLHFTAAAKLFGLTYLRPSSQQEFELDYASALVEPGITLIEVCVPATQSSDMIQALAGQVKQLEL
ncbi:2-succinyl-5-enolpyruvyl-6-hydroxy-3-cyclohexene-1-carboxylic-acid synthase [Motilimonas eburnea]|uniref:2-succinyl-5-enolpyruvyl-6-hydroxy-3- cyclohexene-1-carboxylic-acid synthase n=1 Tax=Motilimonas eburnea TaxID=1737488 RepID=UPI001E5C83C8|nr:2-succinyl-5-enolpyruvyl-6-hydroxy-3-cyclohexene-1-carboxylic-acid synthase [Motilimonas eburnea]MCE2573576.1 2-succinyl-5-enolpyruvyl-6-hydroxy-3-cyclohexene-1-carboxylic-acid synthase [Motilimonas eburnea]